MGADDRSDSLTQYEQTGPVATCCAPVGDTRVCGGWRYRSGVKLTGRGDDELLTEVWTYLTAEEVFFYFEDGIGGPGWHPNVSSEGRPELTRAISPALNRYGDGAALCSS